MTTALVKALRPQEVEECCPLIVFKYHTVISTLLLFMCLCYHLDLASSLFVLSILVSPLLCFSFRAQKLSCLRWRKGQGRKEGRLKIAHKNALIHTPTRILSYPIDGPLRPQPSPPTSPPPLFPDLSFSAHCHQKHNFVHPVRKDICMLLDKN